MATLPLSLSILLYLVISLWFFRFCLSSCGYFFLSTPLASYKLVNARACQQRVGTEALHQRETVLGNASVFSCADVCMLQTDRVFAVW